MNSAANTTASGGLSTSVVIIVNWLLGLFHVAAMPTDVSEAWGFVLMALFGYYFHLRTQNGNLGLFLNTPTPAAAGAPTAASPGSASAAPPFKIPVL